MDLSIQQQTFLKNYLDIKSETFGNALQSALKAKYSQEYAESITHQMPDWLAENLGKAKMVKKAEKNLDMALDGLLDDAEKGKKEIQWKATEMTLRTLKKQDYSERTEHTGDNGEALVIAINYNAPNGDKPETNS